ncbi:hypothetical protein RCO48_39790 [Peribacillus frigoritolerans]|nr:hypothetical protein [Peribacillus frigoritolerans]
MEESAQSRLYAGVHFNVDNKEGLNLGRQIGEVVVSFFKGTKSKYASIIFWVQVVLT